MSPPPRPNQPAITILALHERKVGHPCTGACIVNLTNPLKTAQNSGFIIKVFLEYTWTVNMPYNRPRITSVTTSSKELTINFVATLEWRITHQGCKQQIIYIVEGETFPTFGRKMCSIYAYNSHATGRWKPAVDTKRSKTKWRSIAWALKRQFRQIH